MTQHVVYEYDNAEEFVAHGKLTHWRAYIMHLRAVCDEHTVSLYQQNHFTLPNNDEVRIGTKTDGGGTP